GRLTQRRVLRSAVRFSPDFVFLSKCLALEPDTVASIVDRKSNAMWYHDPQWHADLDRPDIAHIATIGRLARIFFVTGFESEWKRNGLTAAFLPAAGDSAIHPVTATAAFESEVAFIGSGYDEQRARLLLQVAARHKLRVWGPGWDQWQAELSWNGRSVEGKDFAAVCSSASITLGINPARAAGGVNYTSDRTWMVILAGGFYLVQHTPGVAAMLREGEHCAFYEDAASCLDQCARYLADPAARERIRAAGESFVRANHTYDQRISNLVEGREYVNPLGASL
ncbi:MAG: glycosyltransferase, partial [Gemmatimonadota bacterium]|nr:glycosyltransferase [Gemmatimonadota bacterium]